MGGVKGSLTVVDLPEWYVICFIMFMDEIMKRQQRSKIMAAIKSKGTSPELLLAKALWHRGNRYRKNDKSLFGTPDLSFKTYKTVVFIDSEFFHGYNWEEKKAKLKDNREYWIKKIERNMSRDIAVNEYYSSKGWTVIRLWSLEVKKSLYRCVRRIENEMDEYKKKVYYK